MFCPACRSEYREGFSRCADCDVDLVDELPPLQPAASEPKVESDVATVLATSDPVTLMTARSMLDEAGIPNSTRGEGIQDLFGAGRFGTGFSLVAGPIELRVDTRWQSAAEEVLRELAEMPAAPAPADDEPEEDDGA